MGMGYITPEITGKLPGYLSPSQGLKFEDIPNGLGAISKVPVAGWLQILAYFGFCEFSGGWDDYKTGTPGDYGFKVLTSDDPEAISPPSTSSGRAIVRRPLACPLLTFRMD